MAEYFGQALIPSLLDILCGDDGDIGCAVFDLLGQSASRGDEDLSEVRDRGCRAEEQGGGEDAIGDLFRGCSCIVMGSDGKI